MSAEDKKVDSHSFCIVIFLFTGILKTLKKNVKKNVKEKQIKLDIFNTHFDTDAIIQSVCYGNGWTLASSSQKSFSSS